MPPVIDRSMRLPDGEYFATPERKTGLALHHTVGGSARSTFRWWMEDRNASGGRIMVGTAYLIERDGTIFEVFDPAGWGWQFGLPWPQAKKIKFERRFVGIELASEGGLIESGGQLYCFDRVSPKTLKPRAEAFDAGRPYRGYRYFDKYEDAQVRSLLELINQLCDQFPIPRRVPNRFLDYYGEQLADFQGIIGHTMVRKDKSDPAPDQSLWDRIINQCRVTAVPVGAPPAAAGGNMTDQESEQLFNQNVEQINQMNVAAGSMVKGLIMELERGDRKTYIRLRNATPSGHKVEYDLVQGERTLVGRIARALGFKTVTDSVLEVRGG
ncbi:MAG: N-acetylmuramoyl-L-alanine amidase [Gemmatimonadetes bacterium]|nr:N-acetylmuramoyl-L-alanine amidase [Gemmatimonadota bacterium]